jgi:hypothetical protein
MAREASYQSLAKAVGIKSPMSVRSWTGYLKDAYLIKSCLRYDPSLKKQHSRNRKFYGIDTGVRNAVAFRFSDDIGMLLETMVWLELHRQGKEVYWFKGRGECDFLTVDRGMVMDAIQVCAELTRENRDREITGLMEAGEKTGAANRFIITIHQDGKEVVEGDSVRFLPFWRWIMEGPVMNQMASL